jgi:hypothetical protein
MALAKGAGYLLPWASKGNAHKTRAIIIRCGPPPAMNTKRAIPNILLHNDICIHHDHSTRPLIVLLT